jgi:hypothetical protein
VLSTGAARDPEVQKASDPVAADQDVFGRDVAMDDAERLSCLALGVVNGLEALQDAASDGDRDGGRHRLPPLLAARDQLLQALALHELHHHQKIALLLDHVEGGHHVGVADARRQAQLVAEHVEARRIARQLAMHALDRDHAR